MFYKWRVYRKEYYGDICLSSFRKRTTLLRILWRWWLVSCYQHVTSTFNYSTKNYFTVKIHFLVDCPCDTNKCELINGLCKRFYLFHSDCEIPFVDCYRHRSQFYPWKFGFNLKSFKDWQYPRIEERLWIWKDYCTHQHNWHNCSY